LVTERRIVIGVKEGEAFDGMGHRPFRQAAADVLVELETERPRCRQLDRTADPERQLCRREQGGAPRGLVEEDAIAAAAPGNLRPRLAREILETIDARPRRADAGGDRLELDAVVDGESL